MVVVFSVYYTFGIFFKPVLTEFGWTRAMTSGAFSLSWIVNGFLGIVMGGLNDRLGPRVVITLCSVILGLGYLLMSQIGAVWQLYLFYGVIIGAGLSGFFVPLASTVARWFFKRRNTMTGILVAGLGLAGLIGPPVANWLISTYDWRVSYIILGSIVLVVAALAAQFLKRDPAQMGQVPYGQNEGVEQELKAGTEGFSLREAVYTRQFWLVAAMFLCYGFCLLTTTVHLAAHVTDLGISTASAATILATIGGLSIIGKVVLGRAADRIGNRQVFIICFILMSASFFWLIPAREVWMLYLFAAVFGLAYGGCVASQSPLIAVLFGLRSHGLILGVTTLGFTSGAALGPFLSGYIFDITGSYQLAFIVSAALSIVGLVLTAFLTPLRGEQAK